MLTHNIFETYYNIESLDEQEIAVHFRKKLPVGQGMGSPPFLGAKRRRGAADAIGAGALPLLMPKASSTPQGPSENARRIEDAYKCALV